MLNFGPQCEIFLVAGSTDMRKSYDTLAALVRQTPGNDPLSGRIFVFCNRRKDRLKILFWERGGFWLVSRRLEQGTFAWPADGSRQLQAEELLLIASGIDLKDTRRRRWYERPSETK
jgi:transposase